MKLLENTAHQNASLLTEITISTLLVGIGNLLGCQIAGSSAQPCYVAGINIGQAIIKLVHLTVWSVAFGIVFMPRVSIGLFAGLFILIRWCCPRKMLMSLGIGSIWYVSLAPAIASFIFVMFVGNAAQCSLNEGGVGDCYVFGVNAAEAEAFYTAGMMPLVIFLLVPLCGLFTVIYSVLIKKYSKNWQ